MLLECIANALNIRAMPEGKVLSELRAEDLLDVSDSKANSEWVLGKAVSGISAGIEGYVRRKWLIQHFNSLPTISTTDRTKAAQIILSRTNEFDSIRYELGSRARTWQELKTNGFVDCSGWIYLLSKEILSAYQLNTSADELDTYSDKQITNCGTKTKCIISGKYLQSHFFQPGVLLGIDFSEYSWDRGRPLDIDHIVMIGGDSDGLFISQSSSSGAGVNRVPLSKWIGSQQKLISAGRVHLVDLFSLS